MFLDGVFIVRMGRETTSNFQSYLGHQTKYEARSAIVSRAQHFSWPPQPPGFFVLDFDHHQPLRRHRWPGFRAIPQFEQAINILRL